MWKALGYGPRATDPSAVGKAALGSASEIHLLLLHTFPPEARGDLRILLTSPNVENPRSEVIRVNYLILSHENIERSPRNAVATHFS